MPLGNPKSGYLKIIRPSILVCVFLFLIFFILGISIRPLIISVAKQQLSNVFIGSKITIGSCSLRPWQIGLDELEISRRPLYQFKVKKIRLDIRKISLEDLDVNIDCGKQSISQFRDSIKTSSAGASFSPGELALSNLALDVASKELDFRGKFTGSIVLETRNASLKKVKGDLSVVRPGGALTINDTRYLENVAQNSGQSLDLLVESFKNYHYDSGIIRLSLDGRALVLDVSLSGETGKRNLVVTFHQ